MLLSSRILFFGGKGGVGKTTLAAATALTLADRGRRTLLVSTDPAHSTGDILRAELGPDPRPVVADCWALELDPETEADRYIAEVKARLAESVPPRLVAEVERQIDIARVSPGAVEAALFDRFARIVDEEGRDYDHIVFDTAPTGQTLHLLTLPEHMSAWIGGLIGRRRKVNALGRMWRNVVGSEAEGAGRRGEEDAVLLALEERRARFLRVRAVLTDSEHTAFFFVVVPERLPIWETARAAHTLDRHGIPVAGILVNQLLPDDLGAFASPEFARKRKEREAEHLKMIERELGAWPLRRVALRPDDPVGADVLRTIGRDLWEGYESPSDATHEVGESS